MRYPFFLWLFCKFLVWHCHGTCLVVGDEEQGRNHIYKAVDIYTFLCICVMDQTISTGGTSGGGPVIEASWKVCLEEEFSKPYFLEIKETLLAKKAAGEIIYPPGGLIFNAFALTPFDQVKVVLLGQDPYHGTGQAHGLSFSVPEGVRPPPSLQNIFKEVRDDVGGTLPSHGNLTQWAKQGVLLLNAILTVSAGQPASHQHIGWQFFTDAVIRTISQKKKGIVFLLWGNYAKNKKTLIDISKHLVLEAAHPSPYSASAGFFGCRHFSQANTYLVAHGQRPITWLPL